MAVQLRLTRRVYGSTFTLGEIQYNGDHFCYTVEDQVRPADAPKVPGKTAIPAGTYKVVLNWSPHFKRIMPLLLNVPNFSGIRIHSGYDADDTEGCIIVGYNLGSSYVLNSRTAYNDLMERLQAEDSEDITLEVRDDLESLRHRQFSR